MSTNALTPTPSQEGKGPGKTPAPSPLSAGALWVGVAVVLATLFAYAWLVTYGTGRFSGEETWGSAFDSLGKSLLSGRADVEPDSIAWEGFNENGKVYLSFGPFPALLRIVPNKVLPSMYGRWSRLSCLAGAVLCFAAVVLVFGSSLRRPGEVPGPASGVYFTAGLLGFGLGTPLVYLVSCGRIYHEAIIWGLCGSLWSIHFILRILSGSISRRKGLLGLSIAFGVALLSRVTFGVPIALAMAFMGVREGIAAVRARRLGVRGAADALGLFLSSIPALGAVFFLFWYNHARFGSIWKNLDFQATYVHPEQIGGVLNLARAPSALWNYFGFTTASLSAVPPCFRLAPVRYFDNSIFFGWKEQTLSLLLGSSWLVVGAALGLVGLLWRRWRSWEALILLAFLPEVVTITSFYFVTQRYAAEFLPVLVFLFAAFLADVGRSGRPAIWLPWVFLVLAGLSALATLASTLEWNLADNGDAPREYKTRLVHILNRVGQAPGCNGLRRPITDCTPVGQKFSFAAARFDRTWDDQPISLEHIFYSRGVGMHANSRITYRVPEGATALCAVAGLPDSSSSCQVGSVVFEVRDEADHLLARSDVVRSGGPAVAIVADLRGAKEVTLVVSDAGDGIDCDHGTWGDPVFLLAPERSGTVGRARRAAGP